MVINLADLLPAGHIRVGGGGSTYWGVLFKEQNQSVRKGKWSLKKKVVIAQWRVGGGGGGGGGVPENMVLTALPYALDD